jgi:hypothetical protein
MVLELLLLFVPICQLDYAPLPSPPRAPSPGVDGMRFLGSRGSELVWRRRGGAGMALSDSCSVLAWATEGWSWEGGVCRIASFSQKLFSLVVRQPLQRPARNQELPKVDPYLKDAAPTVSSLPQRMAAIAASRLGNLGRKPHDALPTPKSQASLARLRKRRSLTVLSSILIHSTTDI